MRALKYLASGPTARGFLESLRGVPQAFAKKNTAGNINLAGRLADRMKDLGENMYKLRRDTNHRLLDKITRSAPGTYAEKMDSLFGVNRGLAKKVLSPQRVNRWKGLDQRLQAGVKDGKKPAELLSKGERLRAFGYRHAYNSPGFRRLVDESAFWMLPGAGMLGYHYGKPLANAAYLKAFADPELLKEKAQRSAYDSAAKETHKYLQHPESYRHQNLEDNPLLKAMVAGNYKAPAGGVGRISREGLSDHLNRSLLHKTQLNLDTQ